MGHNVEMSQVSLIQNALTDYNGFTSGEKRYCIENLQEWISREKNLDTMINKLAEKSLDAKPFLRKIGLIA